jgi:hypothetical protein
MTFDKLIEYLEAVKDLETVAMLRQLAYEKNRLQQKINIQSEIIDRYVHMLACQDQEIERLGQQLELATWDEDAWKKYKKDHYEVINLYPGEGSKND